MEAFVAFALKNQASEPSAKKPKRSPLAGLFGRSDEADDAQSLPEMDVAAGLDRALRRSALQKSPSRPISDPAAENIRAALLAIESALYVVDTIRETIEQAYEIALSAHETDEIGARALLAESFDELRGAINAVVDKADESAAPLVGKNQRQIDVKLGGKASYSVSPFRLDTSPKGLNINPPRDAFSSFEEIKTTLDELDSALRKADRAAAAYCRDAQFLILRLKAADKQGI